MCYTVAVFQKRDENRKSMALAKDKLSEAQNDPQLVMGIKEELESIQSNMEYIEENIVQCQKCLVELEESKSGSGENNRAEPGAEIIDHSDNPEELKYLLTHLCSFALTQVEKLILLKFVCLDGF